MRTAIFIFALIYAGITLWATPGLLRQPGSLSRKLIPLTTSAYWILGMAFLFVPALAPAREWLQYLFFGALFLEGFEYTRDYQDKPFDLDLSDTQNHVVNLITVLTGAAVELPAILITFFHLWPERSAALYLGAIAAVCLGIVIATRLRPASRGQGPVQEMDDWLASPLEFGRRPDEIRLIDERRQHWPGIDALIPTALVAFRYDEEWNVGLVGPATFAFVGKQLSPDDPERAYTEYRAWYEEERVGSLEDSARQ